MDELLQQVLAGVALIALVSLAGMAAALFKKYATYLELGAKDKQVSITEANLAILFNGAANGAEIAHNLLAEGKLKTIQEVRVWVKNYLLKNLAGTVADVKPTDKQLENVAEVGVARVATAREAAAAIIPALPVLPPVGTPTAVSAAQVIRAPFGQG